MDNLMRKFFVIAFLILELGCYLAGFYFFAFGNDMLTGIFLICIGLHAKLSKIEEMHKLEKQGKL